MEFRNSIRFEHGSLKRGESCLLGGLEGVYLGSYKEGRTWYHMFLPSKQYVARGIFLLTDKAEFTHHTQQAPEEKGQMKLC